jgi:hypothetical protein
MKLLRVVTELGNPVDDLSAATVLMVAGGQLILLRPRKVSDMLLISQNYLTCVTHSQPHRK